MINPRPSLIAVGLATCLCGVAFGQGGASSRSAADLRRGVSALESENPIVAEQLLGELVRRDPRYYDRELGSAVLWHGRSIMKVSGPDVALGAWASGWRSLVREGITDVSLGLEVIWSAFENGQSDYYDQAASIYLGLIEGIPLADERAGRRLRKNLLEPFLLIAPSEEPSDPAYGFGDASEESLSLDEVRRITTWWRSLDPLPATRSNERLIEHLRRLVYASTAYPGAEGDLLDDRGKLFVRLGEPWRRHVVLPPRSGFLRSRRQTGSGLRVELTNKAYTLPRNEFWVYSDVDPAAQYLFVANPDGSFSIGSTYDLLPIELRTQRHSLDQLDVMAHILRELALLHPDSFEHAYTRVSTFLTDLELNAFAQYATNMSAVSAGDSARMGGLRIPMEQSVASFARMAVYRNRADERRAAKLRDARVPVFYFDDFRDVAELSVNARWARFLSPKGETRMDVFWATPSGFSVPEHFGDTPDRDSKPSFEVDFTFARYDEAFESRVRNVMRTIGDPISREVGGSRVFTSTIPNLHRNESIGLQWDVLLPATGGEPGMAPSAPIGTAIARIHRLEPLDNRRLEMSDLVPVRFLSDDLDDWQPYLPDVVTGDVDLGLWFEVYQLRFNLDDRTRYSISYEVRKEGKPLIRSRAYDPEIRESTRTLTRRSGASSRASELVRIDLQDWNLDGELEIIVTVRDETNGDSVRRSLSFRHDA